MSGERVRIQIPPPSRQGVPLKVAEMAYAEYARQYGTDQSFERLQERGGFGMVELMLLLCDRIVFVEARARGLSVRDARAAMREWQAKS